MVYRLLATLTPLGASRTASTEPPGKPEAARFRYSVGRSFRRSLKTVAAILSVAVLGALAWPATDAFAYCRTTTCAVQSPPPECTRDLATGCWQQGIPLLWPQQCISYAVSSAGSKGLGLDYAAASAIIDQGFAHWPTAACSDGGAPSIAFMSRPGLTCDLVEYNPTGPNANAILFRDEGWKHDPMAIALTTVAFNVRTGVILDADMEINTPLLTEADLEFVATHESGHFLGLDHSPDPTAIMFFQYAGGGFNPRLSTDDLDAICTAYPTARSTPVCDFEPPKGFATDCGGDVVAACAVAPAAASERDPGWIGALGLVAGAAVYRLRQARRQARQRRRG